jgi:rhodanese-related sulfurtransferase
MKHMSIPALTFAAVRSHLLNRHEIALLDLREEHPFAQAHPLWAANLPLSQIERDAARRIPRRDTLVVLYGEQDGVDRVAEGFERFTSLGYTNVHGLDGGLEGWRAAGGELFRDVNVPSKAFGELVEHERRTPSLSAQEVKALIDSQADVVVLDARRFDEYQTMSIPTATSVPGAELVLRARELAPDPKTRVIVNCAGRTRSIIGTQSLVNAGLPNPVAALRNGTIGWKLAGQVLDHGAARRAPAVGESNLESARQGAKAIAARAGVKTIALGQVGALESPGRTLYRFDVRTPEEYAAGHLPGFASAPGGQLVQETDHAVPVRGARIVLADPRGVRADMSASWLAQMGWEVYVLDAPDAAFSEPGPRARSTPTPPDASVIDVEALARLIAAEAVTVLDLGPSPAHRRGHIPGAWFGVRARLASDLRAVPGAKPLVITSPDGVLARFAAAEIEALTGHPPRVLDGGTDAWIAAGYPLETGLERAISTPDDVYRRPYEGADHAPSAMQAYLDWEFGLVAQLQRDGTHGFYVI